MVSRIGKVQNSGIFPEKNNFLKFRKKTEIFPGNSDLIQSFLIQKIFPECSRNFRKFFCFFPEFWYYPPLTIKSNSVNFWNILELDLMVRGVPEILIWFRNIPRKKNRILRKFPEYSGIGFDGQGEGTRIPEKNRKFWYVKEYSGEKKQNIPEYSGIGFDGQVLNRYKNSGKNRIFSEILIWFRNIPEKKNPEYSGNFRNIPKLERGTRIPEKNRKNFRKSLEHSWNIFCIKKNQIE